MNLPNRLTVLRIALIPVILLIYLFPYAQFGLEPQLFTIGTVRISLINIICLILYLIAVVLSFIGTRYAASNNLQTTFGTFADPVAEKAMSAAMLTLFTSRGLISPVPVIMIVVREIIVDGCHLIAYGNGKVLSEGTLGTASKISQMIAVALILLNNLPFELWELPVSEVMLWFAAFVSMVGGISCYNEMREDILESK